MGAGRSSTRHGTSLINHQVARILQLTPIREVTCNWPTFHSAIAPRSSAGIVCIPRVHFPPSAVFLCVSFLFQSLNRATGTGMKAKSAAPAGIYDPSPPPQKPGTRRYVPTAPQRFAHQSSDGTPMATRSPLRLFNSTFPFRLEAFHPTRSLNSGDAAPNNGMP